jgi:diadenosine tetraphosphatase ApaH/serine/threonine PP2A family protein phosphatase
MTDSYGFRQECLSRFLPRVYSSIIESFSKLPVAAVINSRLFCVHGGLTPDLTIESLSKNSEELLWSDPRQEVCGFVRSDRGKGFYFGQDVTDQFLETESFEMIIRSHEHCSDGFCWPFGEDCKCLTIFSSVNYCGGMNDGSVCLIGEDNKYEIHCLSYESSKSHHRVLIPSFILESFQFPHFVLGMRSDESQIHFKVNIII